MFWSVKVVFIHVPRTGGTVLTDVFGALPWVCKDVLFHKHAKASVAKRLVGPIWKDAIKFAIERPDEEIAVSWYNHIQRYARERTEADRNYCTTSWWNLVTRCQSMDFDEFCRQERVPTMDFYCDLPEVQRLPFSDAFTLLCDVLGHPGVDIRTTVRTSAMPKAVDDR